jgi:hypothetical protein
MPDMEADFPYISSLILVFWSFSLGVITHALHSSFSLCVASIILPGVILSLPQMATADNTRPSC